MLDHVSLLSMVPRFLCYKYLRISLFEFTSSTFKQSWLQSSSYGHQAALNVPARWTGPPGWQLQRLTVVGGIN
jgi:hypothetical protein